MPFKTPNAASVFIRSMLRETDEDLLEIMRYAEEKVIPILLPETAAFLKQLVMMSRPKTALEIGTAIGYSATVILKNSDARLCTVEKDEESLSVAKGFFRRFGLSERADVFCGDAAEIVPLIEGEFDFIFLDGPKTRYPVFYPYLKKLLRTGGILLADNVLFNGMVDGSGTYDPKKATIVQALKEYLASAFSDKDMASSILPVGDGLCLSVKTAEN